MMYEEYCYSIHGMIGMIVVYFMYDSGPVGGGSVGWLMIGLWGGDGDGLVSDRSMYVLGGSAGESAGVRQGVGQSF